MAAIVYLPVLVKKQTGLPVWCDAREQLLEALSVQGFAKGGGRITISLLCILEGHNNSCGAQAAGQPAEAASTASQQSAATLAEETKGG